METIRVHSLDEALNEFPYLSDAKAFLLARDGRVLIADNCELVIGPDLGLVGGSSITYSEVL